MTDEQRKEFKERFRCDEYKDALCELKGTYSEAEVFIDDLLQTQREKLTQTRSQCTCAAMPMPGGTSIPMPGSHSECPVHHPEVKESKCNKPPLGWYCTRKAGHDGPCAAIPKEQN